MGSGQCALIGYPAEIEGGGRVTLDQSVLFLGPEVSLGL